MKSIRGTIPGKLDTIIDQGDGKMDLEVMSSRILAAILVPAGRSNTGSSKVANDNIQCVDHSI